ncbi:hypothetical protein JOB18_043932 [Solea senegalensis]|uniref:Uncharacterized protein n=1 Tax=Solea senegalensis TaxID=28829 RepID=A0AAV6QSA4_SOLSE|nr:hypothetical protein JOB18_043932 [Solea senegalensis]
MEQKSCYTNVWMEKKWTSSSTFSEDPYQTKQGGTRKTMVERKPVHENWTKMKLQKRRMQKRSSPPTTESHAPETPEDQTVISQEGCPPPHEEQVVVSPGERPLSHEQTVRSEKVATLWS